MTRIQRALRALVTALVLALALAGSLRAVGEGRISGTVLDPANYDLFVHRETRFNTQGARQRVDIRSVEWNQQLKTITIRPNSTLKNNLFYEVVARGTTANGIIGTNGEPLDGDFDRFVNPGPWPQFMTARSWMFGSAKVVTPSPP